MRKFVFFLLALSVGPHLLAQSTTVTANRIAFGGVPIATGNITFTPVDRTGQPVIFDSGGGGLNLAAGSYGSFPCTIMAGTIVQPCTIPDAALATPSGIFYSIQITDNSGVTPRSAVLPQVPNIQGQTWALDHYAPTANINTSQVVQYAHGNGQPTSSCTEPLLYTQDDATAGSNTWLCVGGTMVHQLSGAGAAGAAATVMVGTTTTGDPGTQAAVTNSGTTNAAVLNFVIPTGAAGPDGADGQGFNYRGAWAANTAYAAYDVLTSGGNTYLVTAPFTSASTFSTSNLSLLAQAGAPGAAGPTGAMGSQGPAGPAGNNASIPSQPAVAHKWINSWNGTSFGTAQPDYSDLTGTPTIPTAVVQLTRASGDYTAAQVTNAVDGSVSHSAYAIFCNCTGTAAAPSWSTLPVAMIPPLQYISNAAIAPNTVVAGPSTGGSSASPAARVLVPADIPILNQSTTGSSGSISTSQPPNTVLAGPATGSASSAPIARALVVADIPVLNQNTTGTSASISTVQAPNSVLAGPASGSTSAAPQARSLVVADIPPGLPYLPSSGAAAANGTATLDGGAHLPAAQSGGLSGDLSKAAGTGFTNVVGLNGVNLAGLGAGVLKQNGSGQPSLAVGGTDYATPAAVTSAIATAEAASVPVGGTAFAAGYNTGVNDPRNIQVTSGAEYSFLDGSGTVVHDIATVNAASPRNASFVTGSVTPAWTTYGLSIAENVANYQMAPSNLTGGVQTPVTNLRTVLLHVCSWEPPAATTNNGVSLDNPLMLLTNSGNPSIEVGTNSYTVNRTNFAINLSVAGVNSSNSIATTNVTQNMAAGCGHVWAMTLGTNTTSDPDAIYVDGVRQALASTTASASYASASSGYVIGNVVNPVSANLTVAPFTVQWATFDTSEWTPTQIAQKSAWISQQVAMRPGYSATPTYSSSRNVMLGFLGDSGLSGYGLTGNIWTTQVIPTNSYTQVNLAVAGQTAHELCAAFDSYVGPYINPAVTSTWVVESSSDDFLQGYALSDNAVARDCIPDRLHALHQRAVLMDNYFGNATYAPSIDGYLFNYVYPLWRNHWDALIDVHDDPFMGTDSPNANYYQSNSHANAAGATQLAADITAVINYLDGYSAAAPHVVTANYTMTSADRNLQVKCATACTITLPSAFVLTDQPFTINTTGSMAIVMLNPQDGATTSGTASLVPGATVEVRAERTGATASSNTPGYYWRILINGPAVQHLVGASAPPTLVAGPGAGTSPTITQPSAGSSSKPADTDLSFVISLTPGTSPAASGTVVTVNFSAPFAYVPKCTAKPNNAATQALVGSAQAQIFDANSTMTTIQLTAGSTALPSSPLSWEVTCTQ